MFGQAVAFGAEEMLDSNMFGAGLDAMWGGYCMRNLLILCGIGILAAMAWTVTAGAQGQGSPGSQGQGALGGPMRLVGGYMSHRGMFITTPPQLERRSLLFFGEPETGPAPPGMPMGGLEAGVPEHLIADYPVVPAIHLLSNAAEQVEQQAAVSSPPIAPGGAETDQASAATAQPNPTASPSSPRPPGTVGPGRPVSGWSGPGLPGPGRPARPRG